MQPISMDRSLLLFTVFLRDITERKEAEARLDQERYLLHTLMDNLPDSSTSRTAENRFLRVNQALTKRFGTESSRRSGRPDRCRLLFCSAREASGGGRESSDAFRRRGVRQG